jgi:hypothetical protein
MSIFSTDKFIIYCGWVGRVTSDLVYWYEHVRHYWHLFVHQISKNNQLLYRIFGVDFAS